MKIVAIVRRSKNITRVLLEDGFELRLDSSPELVVGAEVAVPDIALTPVIRPLKPTDPYPEILSV